MHVLFVHPNFPAQFGHVADRLSRREGWRCSFVTEKASGRAGEIELVRFTRRGGATEQNHYCSRTFENAVWNAHAVFEALKARPDLRPDLVVGHSGFGSTAFLRELYDAPIINYFEYFYHTKGSDLDFRPDFPPTELDRLRCRARNAMLLLDLHNCDRGYSPTRFQQSRLPAEYRPKVEVIFDGIDADLWHPLPGLPRVVAGREIPEGTKVVTYATRGMESMRGFDLFMKAAKRIAGRRSDVLFLVAGEDRVCYGGDARFTGSKSFKDWVLAQDDYDLSRFVFLGRIPPQELARLFSISDVHLYLTVPFVLSWSLLNAMACGATVVASDTAPVREVVEHGRTGLLVDFFDADGLAEAALGVLEAPDDFRHLGEHAAGLVREHYRLEPCLDRMVALFEEVIASPRGPDR
ncbi:glycosyltransferase [Tautonia plasticadhaerens]|uniref:Spore coat protein SA n=1 Tax=Tautonia plasticadhaerens TaxID=2527974 RepID=A0A518GZV0_9BACT|nr:glycosyltransferase [Tautonia plasticadhaerens]QDV34115.1 Spore coat protein SA [Tautonia plasticadhaerens]